MEKNKKYKLEKDKKTKKRTKGLSIKNLKTRMLIIALAGLGAIGIVGGARKVKKQISENKAVSQIDNDSFKKTINNVSNRTCLDEILTEEEIRYLDIIKNYIEISERINSLELERYATNNQSDTNEDNISLEEIKNDIKQFEIYLNDIEHGKLDTNIPTEETTKFLSLANKLKNTDAKICNENIYNSTQKIKSIYEDTIAALFLDYCKLDGEKEKNLVVDSDTKKDDNIYLEYVDRLNNKTYNYVIESKKNNILDENYNDFEKLNQKYTSSDESTSKTQKYNKKQNETILSVINTIKKLCYYKINIKDNCMSGELDQNKYKAKTRKN